jgi:uncharacterized protein
MLRVVAFTHSPVAPARADEEIAMLQFEIDDQTAEDLAVALDRVRQAAGVLDVSQVAIYGKKNRLATQVQILAGIDAADAVADLCLAQTTTLGVRIARVWRRTAHAPSSRPRAGAGAGEVAARPPASSPRRPRSTTWREFPATARSARKRAAAPRPRPSKHRSPMTSAIATTIEALGRELDGYGRVAVAVSGGIDSLTLATLAARRLGDRAEMFHSQTSSVPTEATARTRELAARFGWSLHVIDANEFAREEYLSNPVNRCFFCKHSLYQEIARHTDAQVVSGANTDDLGEYRPGLQAAREAGARHPFVDAGVDKATIRAIARAIGLGGLAEIPASPCLSSRVETGIRITRPMLRRIEHGRGRHPCPHRRAVGTLPLARLGRGNRDRCRLPRRPSGVAPRGNRGRCRAHLRRAAHVRAPIATAVHSCESP